MKQISPNVPSISTVLFRFIIVYSFSNRLLAEVEHAIPTFPILTPPPQPFHRIHDSISAFQYATQDIRTAQ
ncbi:MAG: hypothetical protein Q8M94_08725, partial [Ignavibacteria bacterium]|nr:hypothetical protein [Ignavibacteria bacterium]